MVWLPPIFDFLISIYRYIYIKVKLEKFKVGETSLGWDSLLFENFDDEVEASEKKISMNLIDEYY